MSMGSYFNSNTLSLASQRFLRKGSEHLLKVQEKLSSGQRINTAADDPSGLVISEQLRTEMGGLRRAIRNTQEANNVLGISEGALIEITSILRKVNALAIHSANDGGTSPEQVRANQQELDSALESVNRIAGRTRYADNYMLNGAAMITYERHTDVTDTMDNPLIDTFATRIYQIGQRENFTSTISFSGIEGDGTSDIGRAARRAYFEADMGTGVDNDGRRITADQEFVLTGTRGSRRFQYKSGETLGNIVAGIEQSRSSTGVGAQLIFSSNVSPIAQDAAWGATRAASGVEIYGAGLDDSAAGNDKVTAVDLNAGVANRLLAGKNLDGHGRLYLKVTAVDGGANTARYEFYKDPEMSMLVGVGGYDGANASFQPANNSGLAGDDVRVTVDTANAAVGDVYTLAFAGLEMNTAAPDDSMDTSNLQMTGLELGTGASVVSGIDLGRNTDHDGMLYFRGTGNANDRTIEVFRDHRMRREDLVATGTADLGAAGRSIRLESVALPDGEDSGLNLTLTFSGAARDDEEIGSLAFENMGMRLFSEDYGSEAFLRLENRQGALWADYPIDDGSRVRTVAEGGTRQIEGQDAFVTIDGESLYSDGLEVLLTRQDLRARFALQKGELGQTTVAQTGYEVGGLFSRARALHPAFEPGAGGTLTDTFSYATGPRHQTSEGLRHFHAGMQLQLGEGEGKDSRTTYGIQSVDSGFLGRMEIDGTVASLDDVRSSGPYSLFKSPLDALQIIRKALDDVNDVRAQIGAFQQHVLSTNERSLDVAHEKIARVESELRDADMAYEATQMTQTQIQVQAATSMLAQAGVSRQAVLRLLEEAAGGAAAGGA